MIKIETQAFINSQFSEYYRTNPRSIQPPPIMEKREFGLFFTYKRIMLRHKAFKTPEKLRDSLRKLIPSDVYYSSAYYEHPEEEMAEKGWLGADLIFDIDADHIPSPCDRTHDTAWPCEVCLESAKKEAMKLIDMLDKDFGLSTEEMNLAFSGHRGYHLHVIDKEVLELDSVSRREIADYIVGIGIEPELHGLSQQPSANSPNLDDIGWKGRIARGTYEYLQTATPEQLKEIQLPKKVIQDLNEHMESILESWKHKGPWPMIKGVNPQSWKRIVEQAVKKQAANIDTVVTTDVHRLIRLTNTLHGKTGLKKTEVSSTIEKFDPFKSAVAFSNGTASILISEAPEFRIGDESYGPYRNEKAELPMAAAMFLLCKGAAQVVEAGSSVQ